ncbi:MAG: hypothetical protein H7293_12565 [Candidatus Saccharibacteria bacterium]|nr:hypothetical protein [Rhodoferax sp.]
MKYICSLWPRLGLFAVPLAALVLIAGCGGGSEPNAQIEATAVEVASTSVPAYKLQAVSASATLSTSTLATGDSTKLDAADSDWVTWANAGESFVVGGTQVVRYGADGAWVYRPMTGTGYCTDSFFDKTPATTSTKTCQIAPPSSPSLIAFGYTASDTVGYFTITARTLVKIVPDGKAVVYQILDPGSYTCLDRYIVSYPGYTGSGRRVGCYGITPSAWIDPIGWLTVASESGSFASSKPQNMRYGASSSWVYKNVSAGTVVCNNTTWTDPIVGTVKSCAVQSTPWVTIATEALPAFSVTGSQQVRYGSGSIWAYKMVTGDGTCSFSSFTSDTSLFTTKDLTRHCEIASVAPSEVAVANAGQSFVVGGTQTVSFGVNNALRGTPLTGVVTCPSITDGPLGDPAPGFGKFCNLPTSVMTWTKVASENGTLTLPFYPRTVRYGSGSRWVSKQITAAATCNNALFATTGKSDPYSGVVKQCQVLHTLQDNFYINNVVTAGIDETRRSLLATSQLPMATAESRYQHEQISAGYRTVMSNSTFTLAEKAIVANSTALFPGTDNASLASRMGRFMGYASSSSDGLSTGPQGQSVSFNENIALYRAGITDFLNNGQGLTFLTNVATSYMSSQGAYANVVNTLTGADTDLASGSRRLSSSTGSLASWTESVQARLNLTLPFSFTSGTYSTTVPQALVISAASAATTYKIPSNVRISIPTAAGVGTTSAYKTAYTLQSNAAKNRFRMVVTLETGLDYTPVIGSSLFYTFMKGFKPGTELNFLLTVNTATNAVRLDGVTWNVNADNSSFVKSQIGRLFGWARSTVYQTATNAASLGYDSLSNISGWLTEAYSVRAANLMLASLNVGSLDATAASDYIVANLLDTTEQGMVHRELMVSPDASYSETSPASALSEVIADVNQEVLVESYVDQLSLIQKGLMDALIGVVEGQIQVAWLGSNYNLEYLCMASTTCDLASVPWSTTLDVPLTPSAFSVNSIYITGFQFKSDNSYFETIRTFFSRMPVGLTFGRGQLGINTGYTYATDPISLSVVQQQGLSGAIGAAGGGN